MYCFDGIYFNDIRLEGVWSVWFPSIDSVTKSIILCITGGKNVVLDDIDKLNFSIRDIQRGSSFRVSATDIPHDLFNFPTSPSLWDVRENKFASASGFKWLDVSSFVRDNNCYTVASGSTIKLFDFIDSYCWEQCSHLFRAIFAYNDLRVSVESDFVTVWNCDRLRLNKGLADDFNAFVIKLKLLSKFWEDADYLNYLSGLGLEI